jgi:hypothetical protein
MINGCGFAEPSIPRGLAASTSQVREDRCTGNPQAGSMLTAGSKTPLRLELKSRLRVESVLSVSFSATPRAPTQAFLLAHSIPPRWGYLFVTGV